jgi:ZIP family zinc transporter
MIIKAFLWGGLAAASLLVGFYLASRQLSKRTIGIIMGFGAGALLSAIAYELVPVSALGGGGMAVTFTLGALTFYLADRWVDRRGGADRMDIAGEQKGSGSAIFIGTLLDNIPESMVLGMSLALGGAINVAFLIAVFVSNLPEGVAGTVNLKAAGRSQRTIFWMWTSLVIISAACAALGYVIIYSLMPGATGRIAQAFAAGAMLTMLADAMMPEAFQHGGKLVGLVTVMGFLTAAILSFVE